MNAYDEIEKLQRKVGIVTQKAKCDELWKLIDIRHNVLMKLLGKKHSRYETVLTMADCDCVDIIADQYNYYRGGWWMYVRENASK